jgi:methionyl-tRNA formyltransferase
MQRMTNPRIVFMGSPEFALPALRQLAASYPLAGVVTQPDRPAGRGREPKSPPVKLLAEQLGLPVIQPERLKAPEAMEQLEAWQPDMIVVAAFGQILRPDVLDLPRLGCINIHGSLLPRWRGAAPVQAAILNGDLATGVTIMRMDAGVDTGPMLRQASVPILPDDTAGSLGKRMAELGADLLLETLPAYVEGRCIPQVQDDSQATYAPMIKKEAGALDFSQTAGALERGVRAFNPWPGAYMPWQGQNLKIHKARAIPDIRTGQSSHPQPGRKLVRDGLPAVEAADGLLLLETVQPAGKKPMPGQDFLHGARQWEGQ